MEFSEVIEVLDRGSSIDVRSDCTFESLMIGQKTLEKLRCGRFERPSPVQAKAIPVGLLGRDMLVQAKSGTGKTLVFSVLAVENLDVKASYIQKVIITPTREISTQIKETVRKLSPAGTRTSVFVGGASHKFNIIELKKSHPQVVIGTPGRVAQLIRMGALDMSRVDFFVLDEADKLMDDVFRSDINIIINSLPPIRQIAVFSATYPRNLDALLSTFLRDAALVRFNQDDVQLVGIKQYVVPNCSPMLEKLTRVLKSIQYVQALVFCDQIAKCEPIATHLKSEGLDVTFVSSAMSQKDRQLAVDQLRSKRVKILVSSDLTARGIDADNVNLVVNVDAAANEDTYFHRIGRAARFGAHGAAITLLEDEKALRGFTALAYRGRVTVKRVSGDVDSFPSDLVKNQEYWEGLNWFADLNKEQKVSNGLNDLKNVPDRQEAMEALMKSRGLEAGDSESYKYTRDQMIAMRSSEGPETDKNENGVAKMTVKSPEDVILPPESSKPKKSFNERIVELKKAKEDAKIQNGVAKMTNQEQEDPIPPPESSEAPMKDPDALPPKKSFKERLAELKKAKEDEKMKGSAPGTQNGGVVVVETKTKFKFVPTREKAKKKYYMRGELQHIRDAFTAEQWRAFAATKYDLSEEPFLDAFPSPRPSTDSESPTTSKSPEVEVKTSVENWAFSEDSVPRAQTPAQKPKKVKKSPPNDGIIRYNRQQMKQIQQAIPKKSWIPYIKSRYDTSEEPWELDPWMRCSYEERLRRIRKREKDERTKVMEERKKKREEDRSELVACSQTVQTVEIKELSWEEYQARVRREFEEFCAKEEQKKEVEPCLKRIGPVVPAREPAHIYNYRVDMYKRRIAEQDAWLLQTTKLEDGRIKEQEIQTTSEDVIQEEEPSKEPVVVEEIGIQTDEVWILEESKNSKDEEEDVEEDEEYWDEEYEEYWDEDEEEEEAPEDVNLQNPMLQNLSLQFQRNLNLQAAQQSYIDFMNAVTREFRR